MAKKTQRQGWRMAARSVPQVLECALIALIQVYRLAISPLLAPRCRFQPTCSAYAIEALRHHGLLKGGALALRRLARCHPVRWLGAGQGYDPVPAPCNHRHPAHDV